MDKGAYKQATAATQARDAEVGMRMQTSRWAYEV